MEKPKLSGEVSVRLSGAEMVLMIRCLKTLFNKREAVIKTKKRRKKQAEISHEYTKT